MTSEQAFPELAVESTTAPRSLRDILFSHRATSCASALEVTELMAAVVQWWGATDPIIESVLTDARNQRNNARAQDVLFEAKDRGTGQREKQWTDANPGLAALLAAVGDL